MADIDLSRASARIDAVGDERARPFGLDAADEDAVTAGRRRPRGAQSDVDPPGGWR